MPVDLSGGLEESKKKKSNHTRNPARLPIQPKLFRLIFCLLRKRTEETRIFLFFWGDIWLAGDIPCFPIHVVPTKISPKIYKINRRIEFFIKRRTLSTFTFQMSNPGNKKEERRTNWNSRFLLQLSLPMKIKSEWNGAEYLKSMSPEKRLSHAWIM